MLRTLIPRPRKRGGFQEGFQEASIRNPETLIWFDYIFFDKLTFTIKQVTIYIYLNDMCSLILRMDFYFWTSSPSWNPSWNPPSFPRPILHQANQFLQQSIFSMKMKKLDAQRSYRPLNPRGRILMIFGVGWYRFLASSINLFQSLPFNTHKNHPSTHKKTLQ